MYKSILNDSPSLHVQIHALSLVREKAVLNANDHNHQGSLAHITGTMYPVQRKKKEIIYLPYQSLLLL